ncbi:FHA domain-containing protein [Anatilimnocola floriformis]|uniref:FHA domain-containing protein n=1 Tax=Anatilimnocola floriformis TaxID=2948575 RepID=UPI0020C5A6A8|nr:FHA domain-containing protein [Anatilimnocola floriformis]
MLGTINWRDREGCRSLALVGQEVVIGRSSRHAIALLGRGASRWHARLFAVAGQYFVEDLNSQNGTRCDGRRVSCSLPLLGQHVLEIGDEKIEVEMKPRLDAEPADNSTWYREQRNYWFRCWWRLSWTQFSFGWGWEQAEAQ